MNWYNNLDLKKKLLGGFTLVALIAGVVGAVGITKIKQLDDADTALYEQNTQPLGHLTGIVNEFQKIRVNNLYALLSAGNSEKVRAIRTKTAEYLKDISEKLAIYEKGDMTADDKKLTAELKSGLAAYDQLTQKELALAEAGKLQEAMKFIETDGAVIANQMNKIINDAVTVNVKNAKEKSDSNTLLANGAVKVMIILVVSAVLLAIGLGIFISRIIMLQLGADPKKVGEVANLVAAGDLSHDIQLNSGDNCSVMASMKRMVDGVRALVADATMLSRAAVEGKLATRADAAKHQGDFRKIVTGVNGTLDAVIGPLNVAAEYVDRISKGDIPPKITDSYNGDFNEIKNNLNTCIDAVTALVTDANTLSQAAIAGKLATRADAAKHQGDFRKIVTGVNETLDAVIGPLNVTAEYVDRISKGDIPPRITDNYNGDFNEVKLNLNNCIDNINLMVTDANILSQAAIAGKLATRADAAKHQGDFRKIVMGVNGTLDAVIGPLNVAAEYVDRISKGDIPPKITDSYNGDFNEIKNNLNTCIDAVTALVTDAGLLAQAAIAGKLATRADAAKHQGDFQKIVTGVNGTLDAVIGPLNVAAEYVDRISKGDIPPRITDSYDGDFNELKNNLNTCIDAVNALVTDAGLLAQAAIAGKLATRADAAKHQGDFRKIVTGVNGTLDAVIGPLNVAAEYVDRISKGDIPPKITDSYNGDFNEIKNNLNVLIVAMTTVTEAASQIALGNLTVEVRERSPQDQLMQALTRMVSTLRDLAATAEKIADGDLTVTVKPASEHDVMGNAFAAMVTNLRQIMGNVETSSDSIATATKEIAGGSSDMAQRSESQAASLEEIAASMEELTATVKQNADNSKQADQLANNASSVAIKGGTVITRVVETMESISGSSKKIADIISVIDGIAFQTNILALNAAVEAARAGEQGRGFAVVAGEVRNLAQRSAAAAKEIKELISDSVDKVGNGSKLVGEAGQTMQEIVTSIKKVTDIMAEIATASNEQSVGIEQINSAITSMNDMTQENSLVVQQTSSASDDLEEQVQLLVEAVNRFILDDGRKGERKEPGKVLKMESAPPKVQIFSKGKGVGKSGKANGYHKAKGEEGEPAARAAGHDLEWVGFN